MVHTKQPKNSTLTSHDTLNVMLETLPSALFIIDDTETIVYANASAQALTETPSAEIHRNSFWHCAPQLVSSTLYQAVQQARQRQAPIEVEYSSPVTQIWLHVQLTPTVRGLILQFHQMKPPTPCQETFSEEAMQVLLDTIPQFVWTARPDGSITYYNQRLIDYLAMPLAQTTGNGWLAAVHPDDRHRVQNAWQAATQTEMPYEVEKRLQDGTSGSYRWFLVRAVPRRNAQGTIRGWIGTCTDIDQQKRLEEALHQSQEQANTLMNSNIIGIDINEGEQIVEANDTFLQMTGYTREDLRAGKINWMHMTPPEYLARTLQAQQELDAHQSITPYEKEFVRKNGSRLPVIVGRAAFQDNPSRGIGFILDNSARKELEQRRDDFITVASHDLRGPLTAVKLQAALLKKRLGRQSIQKSLDDLTQIEAQVDMGVRLMETLLDVSRIQTGALKYTQESINLDDLIRETVETIQQTCSTHRIILRGSTSVIYLGDRERLGQVVANLLSNAVKYSPQARTVEIDVSTTAGTVTINVHDHGIGIPPEQREKIFERFYRTTNARQKTIPGLGIGLYLVAEIVHHYKGTITVESQVAHGSTFHVTLPYSQ